MPLCGALLSLTKLSTSFIVNLGLSFSDLVHSIGNTLLAAILDVCAVSLAFTQRWTYKLCSKYNIVTKEEEMEKLVMDQVLSYPFGE